MDSSDSLGPIGSVGCECNIGSAHDVGHLHSEPVVEMASMLLLAKAATEGLKTDSEGPQGSKGPVCSQEGSADWGTGTGPRGVPCYTTGCGPTGVTGSISIDPRNGPTGGPYRPPQARLTESFHSARSIVDSLSRSLPDTLECFKAGLNEISDDSINRMIGEVQDALELFAGYVENPSRVPRMMHHKEMGACCIGEWKEYQGKWWIVLRFTGDKKIVLARTNWLGQRKEILV